jgi:hypothetical protein
MAPMAFAWCNSSISFLSGSMLSISSVAVHACTLPKMDGVSTGDNREHEVSMELHVRSTNQVVEDISNLNDESAEEDMTSKEVSIMISKNGECSKQQLQVMSSK